MTAARIHTSDRPQTPHGGAKFEIDTEFQRFLQLRKMNKEDRRK